MLSGRYPSDEFAELRPRVTWDRVGQTLSAREGALRVAIANAGTIPDRGLYGVFLVGAKPGTGRVGELDEEMVFESRVGETFLLGASTWRIEEITHDRVLVSPAPGEPGKMPFWKGDPAGRPRELGFAIGRLTRELREVPAPAAIDRLMRAHDLDRGAAENLLQYLADQVAATGAVPDDRTIVVERCRDELGDWRVCVLSPLGGKVLIPWCLAVVARFRAELGLDVETMWSDDGFVVRVPDMDEPPASDLFVPSPEDVESLVLQQLGASALFAAKFREVAGRALLLPRHRVGRRAPLWQQRKRAADLLAVASRFGSFPAVLETFRECLRDVFDMPALVDTLQRVARRDIRVVGVDTPLPSPFAASLLFSYVATFLYDGDAPLAERRAQALTVDHAQLRDLLGDAELRELLDPEVLDALERQLQSLDEGLPRAQRRRHPRPAAAARRSVARRTGRARGLGRCADGDRSAGRRAPRHRRARGWRAALRGGRGRRALSRRAGRAAAAGIARRAVAARARRGGRSRPALRAHAWAVYRRHLRAAFRPERPGRCKQLLARLATAGRVLQGEFRPGGFEREWCGVDVLRTLRQRSLARLRKEIEPVEPEALGRLAMSWQGVGRKRRGLDALLDSVEQLQGAPLVASALERDVLPARIEEYDAADLDRLIAAGEVTWAGLEPLGERDGRLALFLTDHLRLLWPPARAAEATTDSSAACSTTWPPKGASFFAPLHVAIGGGYPDDLVDALWTLVWKGLVTNDSLHALRAYVEPPARSRRREAPAFRSRRVTPPPAQGRWSLLSDRLGARPSPTEWATAVARQLLSRHGVLTREAMNVEAVPGGYGAVYGVLRAMEDAGRVRRGMFVAGLGAAQFTVGPRSGPAARRPRTWRDAAGGGAGLDRPGQSVRRRAALARARGSGPAHPVRRHAGHPRRRPACRMDRPRRSTGAGVVARGRTTPPAHRARDCRRSSIGWPPSRHARACSSQRSTACPWAITRWRRTSTRSGSRGARWGWRGRGAEELTIARLTIGESCAIDVDAAVAVTRRTSRRVTVVVFCVGIERGLQLPRLVEEALRRDRRRHPQGGRRQRGDVQLREQAIVDLVAASHHHRDAAEKDDRHGNRQSRADAMA